MPPRLDQAALHEACRKLAHRVLGEGKLVDVSAIEGVAQEYVEIATEEAASVSDAGRDPNLITRAVLYLSTCNTLPPTGGAALRFYEMLAALVELACPTEDVARTNAAFFRDINKGSAGGAGAT